MRVLVAMSGGVDSSVAAAELVAAGHTVVGVTMRLWGGESDTGCCSVADVDDARRVADHLGVEHHVFNFAEEFQRDVVDPYVRAHAEGITPNPCIECNRHLKFDVLMRRADLLGFDLVATGHHARIVEGPGGRPYIGRGVDVTKDQSYVLYPLAGATLSRTLLPIGDLTKAEVRERAATYGLRTATKPDSQDVCFIQRAEGRAAFLGSRIPLRAGRVVDRAGVTLGSVPAMELVTIGQRKGLGLDGASGRRYVVDVDPGAATVTIGDDVDLLRPTTSIGRMVWAHDPFEGACVAQISAHGAALPAVVAASPVDPGVVTVEWERPARRVAPGQSVVLYDGDRVLGGGIAR